jgi:surface antigen
LLKSLALSVLLAGGCENLNNTEKGILTGGALGTGAGALIGAATHHTGAGAAIGAVVGGLSGGLIGNSLDNQERRHQEELAAAVAARGGMGVTDIIYMTQQHVSDDIVINQIRATGSTFNLSANDITWLKQNNVSDAVIYEMQMSATRVPRRVYVQTAPVYAYPPPAVYYVPEPAPVSVGVGFRVR